MRNAAAARGGWWFGQARAAAATAALDERGAAIDLREVVERHEIVDRRVCECARLIARPRRGRLRRAQRVRVTVGRRARARGRCAPRREVLANSQRQVAVLVVGHPHPAARSKNLGGSRHHRGRQKGANRRGMWQVRLNVSQQRQDRLAFFAEQVSTIVCRGVVNETPQLGVAGCGRVWLGVAGFGWVWLGLAGFGWVWLGLAGCS